MGKISCIAALSLRLLPAPYFYTCIVIMRISTTFWHLKIDIFAPVFLLYSMDFKDSAMFIFSSLKYMKAFTSMAKMKVNKRLSR